MKKSVLALGTLLALAIGSLPVFAACPCPTCPTCPSNKAFYPKKTSKKYKKSYANPAARMKRQSRVQPCPCPAAPLAQPCCPNQCTNPCPMPAAPIQTYNDMSD